MWDSGCGGGLPGALLLGPAPIHLDIRAPSPVVLGVGDLWGGVGVSSGSVTALLLHPCSWGSRQCGWWRVVRPGREAVTSL